MSKIIFVESPYCASSGCIEVGKQLSFKTASPAGHSCVEVAKEGNLYYFRDSKTGNVLGPFDQEEWDAFAKGMRDGTFD